MRLEALLNLETFSESINPSGPLDAQFLTARGQPAPGQSLPKYQSKSNGSLGPRASKNSFS